MAGTEALVERLLRESPGGGKPRRVLFRDVRIFVNTIRHAVDTMRKSGIAAWSDQNETDTYLEYVIRIPKGEALGRGPSGPKKETEPGPEKRPA